jgi:hypothetical protein
MTGEKNIWFPGVFEEYEGRTDGLYANSIAEIPELGLIQLVQTRAKEDCEWVIANDHAVGNEDKMRRLMDFVSDEKNILQAMNHVYKENMQKERTVDWLCRELANASKVMVT